MKGLQENSFVSFVSWYGIIVKKFLDAPIAQLDRASDYESAGRGFESLWARHYEPNHKFQ
jgi:hypothetical protein